MKSWRDRARPLVAAAIETGRSLSLEGPALRLYCNKQFPWGLRECHPYSIWKSEVKRQLGLVPVRPDQSSRPADMAGQGYLFGGKSA